MALPDNGAAEIVALVVVAGLGLVTRWVFKPSRKRGGRAAGERHGRA